MSSLLKNLAEKYYKFWINILNLKNKVKIIAIDFNKKWTSVIVSQLKYLLAAGLTGTSTYIFYTLLPILVGKIIEYKNMSYLMILIGAWLIALLVEFISSYFMSILAVQCINSIQYNAFRFFLTVDPIFHTKRESGKLFAKIERAAHSYENFLEIILWDLAPIAIGLITVIVTFTLINIKIGILSFVLLLFIAFINIILNLFYSFSFEKRLIKVDDKFKTINVESLTQIQLIRSYFASDEIADKAGDASTDIMYTDATAWIAFSAINFLTRIAYLISITILGINIINSVVAGTLSTTTGATLFITYLRGTHEVIKIGQRLRKLLRSMTRIQDLFEFIRNFGYQSFPVLQTPNQAEKLDAVKKARSLDHINISVNNLYFDYNPKAKIFENHNLNLKVPASQDNKLYGIIGPSGMGKTTLLSILGGQLKPTKGLVVLNNISIYDIDDSERKLLVTIQGQVASSLSGTLQKNLLLGLPEEHSYTDEQMITVLKEVGIWPIFEEKDGIYTQIGEGGLTLSGGQRQRLNFASLYLRAQYYKPLLILIDEPTSSLDEVSERAITKMINSLAQDALTIVIAHRLKTLKDAVGILDFSLISNEKDFIFYEEQELLQKSVYYKKLIEGQVNIEQ